MKAIMKSIKPKQCANIMNLLQSILIIKDKRTATAIQKLIDKQGYADIYVYCSKDNKKHLYPVALLDKHNKVFKRGYKEDDIDNRTNYLNGKVPFKFRCYKVEEIICRPICGEWESYTKTLGYSEISQASCLENREIVHYLKGKNGYAIHISDLEIFNEPKELSEFYKGFRNQYYKREFGIDTHIDHYGVMIQPTKNGYEYTHKLTKAPQNFCYVEVER